MWIKTGFDFIMKEISKKFYFVEAQHCNLIGVFLEFLVDEL